MRRVWLIATALGLLCSAAGIAAPAPPEQRTLILISLDAFRWDFPEKFHATHLLRLAAEGVRAERLVPAFPSMTFPNHHTIMTGLRPAHHGIIHNTFFDPVQRAGFAFNKTESQAPGWWGGEPIWATAIKQSRTADCYLWPGTGAKMAGLLPTDWKAYEGSLEPEAIVELGLQQLALPRETRPGFVALYFHQVDSEGHKYGPDSPQVAAAVAAVDAAIGRLVAGVNRLHLEEVVSVVIVSDHGLAPIAAERTVALGELFDLTKVQVDFSGAVAGLRAKDGNVEALFKACQQQERHFKTYRRENMPERFHFQDNPRIPPVILLADDTWYLARRGAGEPPTREMNKGTHGYDPELLSMGALFVAWGPAFQRHQKLAPVENVHLYNLFCAALGLKPAPNDGDDRLVKSVLAP